MIMSGSFRLGAAFTTKVASIPSSTLTAVRQRSTLNQSLAARVSPPWRALKAQGVGEETLNYPWKTGAILLCGTRGLYQPGQSSRRYSSVLPMRHLMLRFTP